MGNILTLWRDLILKEMIMPWQEATTMSKRYEFVCLASAEGANIAALCRSFKVSRKTAYKWLKRFKNAGKAGLADVSRRPKSRPTATPLVVEQAVLAVRDSHPAWGGRKIRRRLQDLATSFNPAAQVREKNEESGLAMSAPAASTVTAILRRNGRLDGIDGRKHQPFIRFEHATPNALLQIDFKGHFAVGASRCHPLTLVDDHSRFSLLIRACADEQGKTVQSHLTDAFRDYGLPERMTMDNGAPWGSGAGHDITPLTLWLMRLGIRVSHSRPYHPQTQGKNERFNGTLLKEVIAPRQFPTLRDAQAAFDWWREVYNCERPHDALNLATPSTRYRPSTKQFPETLPPVAYPDGIVVRRVQQKGVISFQGRAFKLPNALAGFPVALEPKLGAHGKYDVRFLQTRITTIDTNPATT
jgi:transposase InsO family protein